MGISLVLTFFVMAPVAIDMIDAASASAGSGSGADPVGPGGGARRDLDPGVRRGDVGVGSGAGGSADTATATTAGTAAGDAAAGVTPVGGAGAPMRVVDLEAAVRKVVPEQYRGDVDAGLRALAPLRAFLMKHAGAKDRATFEGMAGRMGRSVRGDEIWVLAPAFLATELREAFAIAVLLFIPFLVIDLVVALGLAALGLQSTQPQTIALPLKLLLFVAVDGWRLLLEALLRGYA